MNTPASSGSGSLLGWLGLRGAREADQAPPSIAPAGSATPFREARRQLLETIGDFLLANDLVISPDNLLAAHSACSGANPRLARQVTARMQAGEQIDQAWLDEITANCAAERRGDKAIERLMDKLEENLEAFSSSSKAARSATSEYNSQLERHVVELGRIETTGHIITRLADLAKAMAERTREIEQDMRRTEEEARALRQSLDRAKHDAEIDYLTGLPNRRAFEALLEQNYREAQAAIEPLSVAFCDIDHFKRINDAHGHEAGDRVIKAIGETLARMANADCHVARHGGEEFVVLFRGATPDEARQRLDTAREELAGRTLINRKTDRPFGRITFSAGVASVFGYPDPRAALGAADEALYRAKEAGRNRIELA